MLENNDVQKEIMRLLGEGYNVSEIAKIRGTSKSAVYKVIRKLKKKQGNVNICINKGLTDRQKIILNLLENKVSFLDISKKLNVLPQYIYRIRDKLWLKGYLNDLDDIKGKHLLSGVRNIDGYSVVDIDGKTKFEHRLVWEKINGKIPEGHEIHHIDLNRCNNNIDNLICLNKKEHRNLHKYIKKLILNHTNDYLLRLKKNG